MKLIGLLLMVVIVACTPSAENAIEITTEEVAEGINQFTFDFLPLVTEQNTFFSPYSISSALAMTYAGARGVTAEEMAAVLYYPEDHESLHPAFYDLNSELEKRREKGIVLNIANALWIDKTAELLNEYLTLTRRYYGAGDNRVDFINRAEESRKTINNWIEEKTEDKIKDMLQPGDVTPDTRVILTNAIYFLAGWETVFDANYTSDQVFYPAPGRRVITPFMKREGSYKYYSTEQFQMVQIPYEGGEMAMTILLPRQGLPLSNLIDNLDYEIYRSAIENLEVQEVEVEIPKFKFEAKYNLKDALMGLGMNRAFQVNAEFSGMTGVDGEEFFIDEVIHQAFIEVGEKGTEAAAATAVVMRTTSIPEPSGAIIFKADRPFAFFISDLPTNTILFSGILANPDN